MVARGEVELRDVDNLGVRHGDAVHHLAFPGGLARHAPANLRVGDELGELIPHVARAEDAVVLRHQVRRAHEQVHERQLVAHGGEAVKLHESLGQWPRHVPFSV